VIWEDMPCRLTNLNMHGLEISYAPGRAVEVFAARHSHKKSAFLMARYTKVAAMNLEVRRLRAAGSNRERKPVKRLALLPAQERIRAGLLIQFRTNAGGFKATELMTVLELREDQMVVERPGGIRALVNYNYSQNYDVYDRRELDLERGDRIRLTRNNGDDALKSGLRRDRRFIVKSVLPDGTAFLDGGRVLPPKAGHWEYGFCLGFGDKKPRRGLVVCDFEDISLMNTYGWLRPGIELVICAADPAEAEQALDGILAKSRMVRHCAGTDEVSVDLAMATFGYKAGVEAAPMDNDVATKAPADDTMTKPEPSNLEI